MTEFGDPNYSPGELYPPLHLSEAEVQVACRFSGIAGRSMTAPEEYDYESIRTGSVITVLTVATDYDRARIFEVSLDGVISGITEVEGEEGSPSCKVFEGTIVSTTREDRGPGDKIFGLLFPRGFTSLVDSGPEDDYTDRRIRAGLAYFGDEIDSD
jgi:hypothetical protein